MSNFALRIQACQINFSDKERQLATFLLKNQSKISHATISELSKMTNVSTATISRFAKNLGFKNFQELKLSLAQTENPDNLFAEISPDDSPLTVTEKVFAANVDALKATVKALSENDLSACVQLLLNAQQVGIFGLGASNIVALDGYHKFLRTPLDVVYANDFHMQIMAATRLTAKDVMLLISHSGEDRDAIALAKLAQQHQVPLILITSSANSTLAKMADITLISVAEEALYRSEALHALIAQMSIVDALFMSVAIKTNHKIALKIHQEIKKTSNNDHWF